MALIKGHDRYTNVAEALSLIVDQIQLGDKILIKPNFTSVKRQLAATHVDAVRATLDFLVQRTSNEIVIAEGTSSGDAMAGFTNYGYLELAQAYNVRFIDLNKDEPVEIKMLDSKFDVIGIRIAKTVMDADYRISICPPKTHNDVLYTGALKNIVSGAVIRKQRWLISGLLRWFGWLRRIIGDDKLKLHQGYQAMNLNLYELATIIPPHLSIIDGYQAMEGNGPVYGDEIDLGVAIASTDFLACDTVASWLMGIDINQIGYLAYCEQASLGEANIFDINVVGDKLEDCQMPTKPHYKWEEQLNWKIIDHERYLKWISALTFV
ncbi:DUF362 domain-containing protein [Chloroflexota bacterium]